MYSLQLSDTIAIKDSRGEIGVLQEVSLDFHPS